MRVLARAPDHLGDGVMALPALAGLNGLGSLLIAGPPWIHELYRHLPATLLAAEAVSRTGADLAVLFKPSLSAAWAARRIPVRVGLDTDHRRWLLSVAVPEAGPHRVDDLRAVCRAAGGAPEGLPTYPSSDADLQGLPPLPSRAVLLLPGTASPETVRWPGFRALADLLGDRAVFAGGPADQACIDSIVGPHARLPALTLPQLAALAVAATAVVGNDSGLPHLAAAALRAAGRDVADLHVVFGSTRPERTGPPGATAHAGSRPVCWPCYKKSCAIGTPCLDLPAAAVAARL